MPRKPEWELTKKERDILIMRFQPQYDDPTMGNPTPYQEIANKYKMTRQAVEFYVKKAFRKLAFKYYYDKNRLDNIVE